jgi:CelD/BcsL family acetyltransferase involved in cellulose biosynthesis
MRVLEHLLDDERVTEIDLGVGDDPYKRLWASHRRQRFGLLAFDPRTWRGAAGAFRHVVAGTLRDTLPRLGREVRAQAMRHGPR